MRWCAKHAGILDDGIANHLSVRYEPDCATLAMQFHEHRRDIERSQIKARKEKRKDEKKRARLLASGVELDEDGKIKALPVDMPINPDAMAVAGDVSPMRPMLGSTLSGTDDGGDDEEIDEAKESTDRPKIIKKPRVKRNKCVIVADLGGGTADIACHEMLDEFRVKSIREPEGGDWGAMYVNEAFKRLFRQLFGDEVLDELEAEWTLEWRELMENFENAKRNFFADVKLQLPMIGTERHWVCMKNPSSIWRALKETTACETDEQFYEMVSNMEYKGRKGLILMRTMDTFEFDMEIIADLFDTCVTPTCDLIERILEEETSGPDGRRFRYLLPVGGFTESRYVMQRLNERFGPKSKYRLRIADIPRRMLAVVEGACLMGLHSDFICERQMPATYGIAVSEGERRFKKRIDELIRDDAIPADYWESSKALIDKHFNATTKVFSNVLQVVKRVGDKIKIDDDLPMIPCTSTDEAAEYVRIKVYRSRDPYPIFADECEKLLEKRIKLPAEFIKARQDGDATIPIVFAFGDTEMRVAIEVTGKIHQVQLGYDD
jgi:hypothetical protein